MMQLLKLLSVKNLILSGDLKILDQIFKYTLKHWICHIIAMMLLLLQSIGIFAAYIIYKIMTYITH